MTNATIANYCWLDLETTGLDPATDAILEIGAVMTGPSLDPWAEFTGTVSAPFARDQSDPRVQAMHDANGLWAEVQSRPTWSSIGHVEADFTVWLSRFGGIGEAVLCGSGVGFDRKFVDAIMPRAAQYLAYWSIDVGVMRRFIRDVCGRGDLVPLEGRDGGAAGKSHRALEDVQDHLEEARCYRSVLGRLGYDGHAVGRLGYADQNDDYDGI